MRIGTALKEFLHGNRGSAAVEFALVLPFMIVMLLGMFEVPRYVSANMKLANAAQLMANLVAQQSHVTTGAVSNFCDGSKMAMTPLPDTTLKMAVASVTRGATGVVTDWQDTSCGGANAISNPPGLVTTLIPNVTDSAIIIQATYTYSSSLSYVLSSSYTISQTAFARPRNVKSITHG